MARFGWWLLIAAGANLLVRGAIGIGPAIEDGEGLGWPIAGVLIGVVAMSVGSRGVLRGFRRSPDAGPK